MSKCVYLDYVSVDTSTVLDNLNDNTAHFYRKQIQMEKVELADVDEKKFCNQAN